MLNKLSLDNKFGYQI